MPYKKSKILLTVIATSSISCASFAQEVVDVKVDDLTIDVYENNKLVSDENIYASTYSVNKREYTRSRESLPSTGIMQQYTNWKKQLADDTGLSYSVNLSVLGQRGSPNGKTTAIQFQASPSLSWQIFNNEYGTGTINASYTPTRYWNSTSGADLTNRLSVLSAINDNTTKANSFGTLNYSQQFAGNMDWFGFTIGQFEISDFDGTNYDSNQQTNFLNYALSQNGSSSYPSASLGAYLTFTISDDWQINVGMQDANNISGTSISSSDFGKGKYTSFASVSYTPVIAGLGAGQYSILFYNQPGVSAQPGTSNGWSVNFEQALNNSVAIFGRANGVINSPNTIQQSYAIGSVYNNPLGRNALDQIGFATAVNKTNKKVVSSDNIRSYETLLELYWAWGVGNWLTITPDVQFYINPALDASKNFATVASLRTTFMF